MNICSIGRSINLGLVAVWLLELSAYGQMPGGTGPAGMSAALTKLFGSTTAFTAKGNVQVTDSAQKEVANWPMDFALLDKKIRVEIDLTQVRNQNMPAGMGAMLKQLGMAQVISIIRPDKSRVYVIYPDQRAMLAMPLPKEDSEESGKAPKVSKTALGKETIDGHPCVKNKVVITDSNGQTMEATTWDASDLNDLPIQIQTQEKDTTSLVRFNQIQFSRPVASLFQPPGDFTQYDNADDLKTGIMKKMLDSTGKK
jgi:hypothetical protein